MRAESLLAIFVLSGLSSCSSGGGGDLTHLQPKPTTLGTPIAHANDPKSRLASGANLLARNVVVVAVDNYDERKNGKSLGNIYVMDPVQPTDWSGLTLFQSTLNPPDLVLRSGDGVDISGLYQPFAGPASGLFADGILLPEMVKGAIVKTYEGSTAPPIDITIADLTPATAGMKFVGRLVRIKDIDIKKDFDPTYHQATIVDRQLTLAAELFAADDPSLGIKTGTHLGAVTGLLNYFYTFNLCPRSSADIQK